MEVSSKYEFVKMERLKVIQILWLKCTTLKLLVFAIGQLELLYFNKRLGANLSRDNILLYDISNPNTYMLIYDRYPLNIF